MLRRGVVGRAGLQRKLDTQEHYRQIGKILSQSEIQHVIKKCKKYIYYHIIGKRTIAAISREIGRVCKKA